MTILTKWIPATEAEIDYEYRGYKGGNLDPGVISLCTIVNKGNGVG